MAALSASQPATTTTATTVNPRYEQLFKTIRYKFRTTSLGPDRWYILTLASLAAGPDPESADQLYLYLINSSSNNTAGSGDYDYDADDEPQYTTPQARQSLVRRLRETLIKCIPLIGVCKPIEAILAISKVEQPQDRDYTSTREGKWQCDATNHARAMDWFNKIYARDAERTLDLFRAHRDFAWVSTEITYGLFLAERAVLTEDVETQLVVLPAIMSQNLRLETRWHIRGTRRLGVSMVDVKVVCECVRLVAHFFGVRLDRVPQVEEVEGDV